MKLIVLLAILVTASYAKATCTPVAPTKTETLIYFIEGCLKKHDAGLCKLAAFEAEKINKLQDASNYYRLSCEYGEISSCGKRVEAVVECQEQQRPLKK